jgi:FlaA1/EpsC-like NDP-sugar epimerase
MLHPRRKKGRVAIFSLRSSLRFKARLQLQLVPAEPSHSSRPPAQLIRRGRLRALQFIVDAIILFWGLLLAALLRFEGEIPEQMAERLAASAPLIIAVQSLSLWVVGAHRIIWRYFGLRETGVFLKGIAISTSVLLAIRLGLGQLTHLPVARVLLLPIGVLGIDAVLVLGGLVGVRALRRYRSELEEQRIRRPRQVHPIRVLLVGAGRGGHFISRELRARPDQGLVPVGFVDDDVQKLGQVLDGLTVLGTTEDIAALCEERRVERILITVAGAGPQKLRELSERCSKVGLPVMIVPRLVEILDGGNDQIKIRQVTIEDLLGRPPVNLDLPGIERVITDRVVLVTGAGGSIGSELCRQIQKFRPAKLVLVERYENALFEIHRELVAPEPRSTEVVPLVGDVCDADRMEQIFKEHAPEVVLHAAAHKHVPMMEANPGEAVKNNVGGTIVLADAAARSGVRRFVMISTDKAVNPTSVMGCTKRVAELYVQGKNGHTGTAFCAVRFGNVLGSVGSVVPIFREQISKGGPVTVTHPDMVRYFMTIPEACQLVLQASALASGGEVYVLDMGAPVKIVDLARDMIRLSGFRPDVDMQIVFTGIRPGEKLFEELSHKDESTIATPHPSIFASRSVAPDAAHFASQVQELLHVAATDGHKVRDALRRIVPEYTPNELS